MTTPKIISDEADTFFTQSNRKPVNNTLVLTAGGTTQTFFATGAVACLVDNGQFEFDLITAVSGGTILLMLIDLCYNETYNYYKEPDWYNQYVRKNVYRLANAKILPYFINYGMDFTKTVEYIFSCIPDFNKKVIDTINTNIICEYNYIDGNTRKITSDHTDIINRGNVSYLIRTLRCGLPFCNFNNQPSYDAGAVSLIPVSTMLSRYNMNKLVIVKSTSKLLYDGYLNKTPIQLLTGYVSNIMYTSADSLDNVADLSIKPNPDNIMCCASNGFNKSPDKYHNGMIENLNTDLQWIVRYYNGLLYTNENAMKIAENEGYIQMYHQLKQRNQATVFKIPNPEVYNENTKTMWDDWKNNTNVWFELLKDIVEIKV